MLTVSAGDLGVELSRYLDEVRAGNDVIVTEFGVPIARIVPVGIPTAMDRLVAQGKVHRATKPRGTLPPRVVAAGLVSELIDEQRR